MTRNIRLNYERAIDPPEKEVSNIPCPNCGSRGYEEIFRATAGVNDGEYIGCSDCCKIIYYDDMELVDDYEEDPETDD